MNRDLIFMIAGAALLIALLCGRLLRNLTERVTIRLSQLTATCLMALAAFAANSQVFQMRLVLDGPSADSEQMPITHKHNEITQKEELSVRKTALLDQTVIQSASVTADGVTGSPLIEIVFTDEGKERLLNITHQNIGKRIAMIIDGRALCAPRVTGDISSGMAAIRGSFNEQEAKDFAAKITTNWTDAYTNGTRSSFVKNFLAGGANQPTAVQGVNGSSNQTAGTATGSIPPTHLLALIPSVTRGYAPLTVNFTLDASNLPGTVQSIAWDWRGDGTTNLTTSVLSGQSHIYDSGTYFPVVTVTTSKGSFSSGGGVDFNKEDMFATCVGIVADIPPQIVWSQNVAGPVAVKAKADGSVYVLKDNPPTFLLYSNNGSVLASFDLTTIHSSPLTANGFDVDGSGNVYLAMTSLNQILMLKPSGNGSYVPGNGFNRDATLGIPGLVLSAPWDVAVIPDGTAIYVSDSRHNRVVKLNAANQVLVSIGDFSDPKGLCYDAPGRVLVADYGNSRVLTLSGDSIVDGCSQAAIKASADSMRLYVTDGACVRQLDSYSFTFFRQIPTSLGLKNPRSVSIWPSKVEQRVYIADYGNNRVIGVTFPRPDPMRVWNAMKQAVANNNPPEALTYFSRFTSAKYNAEFQALGMTNVSMMLNQFTNITLVDMTDSFAYYLVNPSPDDGPAHLYINFANENGTWKISWY